MSVVEVVFVLVQTKMPSDPSWRGSASWEEVVAFRMIRVLSMPMTLLLDGQCEKVWEAS